MKSANKVDVYLVGSKCIGQYGGYESFVQKLLEYHKDNNAIRYHVACKRNGDGHMDISKLQDVSEITNNRFFYCNADCFLIDVPTWLRAAQAIYYDIAALKECCRHIRTNNVKGPIIYIMASRIGPFVCKYAKKIHKFGGRIYLNPDGHEWKRTKWSAPIRRYWKESERLMVKYVDLIVCDSINIEKYIQNEYKRYNPVTTYIAYGAEVKPSGLSDDDPQYIAWLQKHDLSTPFFTVVGRCVPENNFEIIIREFMCSNTEKTLIIITTDNSKMLQDMEAKLHFSKDKRIKFVGTVYDRKLLKKIREKSYGYIHGHSVGGTNPSLLEALGSTNLNLLFDVCFSHEVAEDAALYWNKENGNLAALINKVDAMSEEEIKELGRKARRRVHDSYSWCLISSQYLNVFTS